MKEDPNIWVLRAEVLQAMEKYRESEEAFTKALEMAAKDEGLKIEIRGKMESLRATTGLGLEAATKTPRGGEVRATAGLGFEAATKTQGGGEEKGPINQDECQGRRVEFGNEFECPLCMELFYDPVTTSCGHSFCKECLARTLDHQSRCPTCRTIIYVYGNEICVNKTLESIMIKLFPEMYKARGEEVKGSAGSSTANKERVLPLFVMTDIQVGERMALNIFEPRYRLLVRRVMSGSRRLGMVGWTGRGMLRTGTMVDLESCEVQPDGRFHIVIRGLERFEILKDWEVDGYRVASTRPLEESDSDNSAEQESGSTRQRLAEFARSMFSTSS